MINTRVFSAAEKQKEREGDRKRDENLSYMRHGVCMCESVFVHACLFGGNDPLPLGSY